MATWILTIGNSDVQLQTEDNWNLLHKQNKKQKEFKISKKFNNLENMKDKVTKRYTPPARVTGYFYDNASEHYNDLVFPLLDVFKEYFLQESEKAIALDHVYVLLSDQSNIFENDDLEDIYCPFWTDTCTLESLIRTYLIKELKLTEGQITALILKPQKEAEDQFSKGIDHWNEMLTVVETVLTDDLFTDSKIYVSHQAGTPAVSSAVQFVSINHGGAKVKFLVSNQFYDSDTKVLQYKAEVIPSSSYWQKIQIIKAQKLLIDGNPSVAKELLTGLVESDILEDIDKQVKQFNLKPDNSSSKEEFEPLQAAKRVRKSLDLIEIFLRNENYLEAIALLAAAHETFLKAAIKFLLAKNFVKVDGRDDFNIFELIDWDNQGLLFVDDRQDGGSDEISEELRQAILNANQKLELGDLDRYIRTSRKIRILRDLKFPVDKLGLHGGLKNLKATNGNNGLLLWLQTLQDDFKPWKILDWMGTYVRLHENDLRNQLMHNLRGIEEDSLKKYFMGFPKDETLIDLEKSILDTFTQEVRSPFIRAMYQIGLVSSDETTNHIQEELKALSDRLK